MSPVGSFARRLRQGAETAGFRFLVGCVRHLPRRRAVALGAAVGSFAFDRLALRRRVAVTNVRERLRPDSEPRAVAIARASYRVMGRTFVDLLRGDLLGDAELWDLVPRESVRALERVHALGQGGLLVSGHFGNWELILLALRRLGVPVAAIAGDQANRAVNRELHSLRERAGITPLSARTGLRQAVRTLRGGGFVATLMDQDARSKGIFADFLGCPASTHTGVLSLAMRTGAPVVPGVAPEEGDRYALRLGPLWRPSPERSEEENLRDGVVFFNRWLEAEVRRAPENYFWAHRRWKSRPPESAAAPGAVSGKGARG